MKKYRIKYEYIGSGYVDVEAENLEEAEDKFYSDNDKLDNKMKTIETNQYEIKDIKAEQIN